MALAERGVFVLHRSKKEDERNDLRDKMRPVYCPKCGWKMLDAIAGTKTQTSVPYKGRYPDYYMKCRHCGTEIGITKIE